MDFRLTDEQRLVQETARSFAQTEVLPRAAEIDRNHRHPKELVAGLAELGLLGVAVPEQYGGAGMDVLSYVLAMEEVSRACASTGVIMSVNNSLVCDPLLKFGNEEQKQKYLAPLASGKLLGCFALSEPEAGSDAAAQKTTSKRTDDGWVINGIKNWITNGPVADVCILFTMHDPAARHRGITAFILPMNTPGVRTGPPDKKLGIRGSQSCQIFLDDVCLPDENRLGAVGEGFKVAMSTLDGGRIGIAAQALGIARAALEDALGYAKERKTFGKPIAEHQAIQFKLADMATQVEAARLLTIRAARLKDAGERSDMEAGMAKLFASEAGRFCVEECLRIHGGYGYSKEYEIERLYRDAPLLLIGEGTSEIQRMVIGKKLLERNKI